MFPFFLILGGQDSIKTRDNLWTNMMTAVAGGVGLSHYQVLPYQRLACDARKGSALFPGWSKFSQKIWWQRWHEVLACRTTKCCRTRDWLVVQKKAALCIRDGANSVKIYDDSGGTRCSLPHYQVLPFRDWPVTQERAALWIRGGANSVKKYDDSGGMRCFPVALPSVAVSEIGRFCIRSGENNSKEQ